MYVTKARGYYRGTEQAVQRGWFLLLLQPNQYKLPDELKAGWQGKQFPWPIGPMRWLDIGASCAADNIYAVVRRVALRQLGNFMMGHANLRGRWVTVSGGYGSDGLPMSVDKLPSDAVKLPQELYDAWSKGKGWNGPGNEADAMRHWAVDVFKHKIMERSR